MKTYKELLEELGLLVRKLTVLGYPVSGVGHVAPLLSRRASRALYLVNHTSVSALSTLRDGSSLDMSR